MISLMPQYGTAEGKGPEGWFCVAVAVLGAPAAAARDPPWAGQVLAVLAGTDA